MFQFIFCFVSFCLFLLVNTPFQTCHHQYQYIKLMSLNRRNFIKISGFAGLSTSVFSPGDLLFHSKVNGSGELARYFIQPPDHTRAACYWWWFNGLVNKKGIQRDLTEFKNKGIGGVLLVNSADGLGGARIPQGVKLFSDEWKELFRFAMKEAKRLNIEVGINLSSGWCMGGPWIQPGDSGRWYLQSTLEVKGPIHFNDALPLPNSRSGYDKVFNPPGYKDYIGLPLEKLDYQDTSIVAIPINASGNFRITGERLGNLDAKTNRRDASNFAKSFEIMDPVLKPWINENNDTPIAVDKIIDLTSLVKDGILNWEVPHGNWIIVRTGHRMTGSRLMIAQPEADGLSIDWFDRRGVELQFKHFGTLLLEEAAKVGAKPAYFCDDSFEDGFPNWTGKILEKFRHYRGYDATPYLPVLSGFIIGSADISDRFLNDYRKTIADCMADEHYGRFAELCHQQGLLVQNEAAGPSRSGTICLDGLKNLGRSDMPAGEFWLGPNHEDQNTLTDDKTYGVSRLDFGQNKVTKMVASAAHIYGRKTVSAEAFTTMRHWQDSPASLKQSLDRAFCEGINRIVIHSTTSTRPEDGLPGYEYGAGTHFNPNVTWWELSSGFLTYIARCQHLLRAGTFVADVLFYNGDNAPNLVAQKHINPRLGNGYDYDVCNEEILLTRLSVKDGWLVLPGGMRYRLLVLPASRRMPLPVLKKIQQLAANGATIIGKAPDTDSGLKNYPQCDSEIKTITNLLWDQTGKKGATSLHNEGNVLDTDNIRQVLESKGIEPDFEFDNPEAWIDFIHRSSAEAEIYFLTNRHKKKITATCSFRVSQTVPELWNAVDGSVLLPEYVVKNNRILMRLSFDVFQSVFVVFPKNRHNLAKRGFNSFQQEKAPRYRQTLSGPWAVNFDEERGGAGRMVFEKLTDWTRHEDPRIQYYSGKAIYEKVFDVNGPIDDQSIVLLELGEVKDICRITINGKDRGIIWTAPWQINVSGNLRRKNNHLKVEVINLWPNRLIGDAALPQNKRITKTNIAFKKDAPLLSSGLIGPVTLSFF